MRNGQKSDMTPTSDDRNNRRKHVPEKKGQITIWGRANSVNVQKVLWCLSELDLAYERIDAGMAFGRNRDPEYLAMNPNARVPTLVDGDYVLWESHSIMRYLVLAYRPDSPIYPDAPKRRAAVDRWLDWVLSTVQPADRPVFWALVRTPPEQRDMVAIQKDADAEAQVWEIADAQLTPVVGAPAHRRTRGIDAASVAAAGAQQGQRRGDTRDGDAIPARRCRAGQGYRRGTVEDGRRHAVTVFDARRQECNSGSTSTDE